MSRAQVALIVCGACVGAGGYALVRSILVADFPRLPDALALLSSRATAASRGDTATDGWSRRTGRPGRWLAARLLTAGLPCPRRELALIGWTPEGYALRKLGLTTFGAVLIPLMSATVFLAGVRLPFAVPAAGSVVLAVVLFFVVDLVARDQAKEARDQFRRALCSYLDLISLRRDASEGPTAALERAAALSGGWVFRRLRDALITERLAGRPPWDGLRRLGEETGVSELSDIADIAVIAAEQGASIAPTLRARAQSLRLQLLAEDEALANTASEKLSAPVALLSVAFLLLFLYPALSRLLTT